MLDLEAIRALAEPNAELTAFLASPDRPAPPDLPDIASRRASPSSALVTASLLLMQA